MQEIKVVKGVSAGWGTCFRTVSLDSEPWALACWKDIVAVGLYSGSIIILNAITGSQVAILSGHACCVGSLVFSPDGALLVSGSWDHTVKLWDMQTGGVVKTFWGHTHWVISVSISADCTTIASAGYNYTTIASGAAHKSVHLWDIQTGECDHIEQESTVMDVYFSPLNPKHLIYISDDKIWQWDISGQKFTPESDGSRFAFSLDGTQFVVCSGPVVKVQRSGSKEIVATFSIPSGGIKCCCFSPDNQAIAVAAGITAYIWNITGTDPQLVETFTVNSMRIFLLAFSSPSSLITISQDKSVEFWQIRTSSTDPVPADLKSTPPASAPIKSITLQAEYGIAISSHSDGVVRIWDISTGLCRTSIQTPAKDPHWMDTNLTDGGLISVWCTDNIYIWDTETGKLLRTVQLSRDIVKDLRISGDGSIVFCLYEYAILAWSLWTGEIVGKLIGSLCSRRDTPLTVDGLRVWVWPIGVNPILGWDFGLPGSYPVKLLDTSQNRPCMDFVGGARKQRSFLPGVQDSVSRRIVFQLPERLARCSDAQWDGQYLVAGYSSGEVLILECNHVLH